MNDTSLALIKLDCAIEDAEELETLVSSSCITNEYLITRVNYLKNYITETSGAFQYFLIRNGINPNIGLPDAAAVIIADLSVAEGNTSNLMWRICLRGAQPKADEKAARNIAALLTKTKQRIEALTPKDLTPKEEA